MVIIRHELEEGDEVVVVHVFIVRDEQSVHQVFRFVALKCFVEVVRLVVNDH